MTVTVPESPVAVPANVGVALLLTVATAFSVTVGATVSTANVVVVLDVLAAGGVHLAGRAVYVPVASAGDADTE